jgi:hypothetical protein
MKSVVCPDFVKSRTTRTHVYVKTYTSRLSSPVRSLLPLSPSNASSCSWCTECSCLGAWRRSLVSLSPRPVYSVKASWYWRAGANLSSRFDNLFHEVRSYFFPCHVCVSIDCSSVLLLSSNISGGYFTYCERKHLVVNTDTPVLS